MVKNLPANSGDIRDIFLQSRVGKIPQRRVWQPTLAFLPGESNGYRSLVDYSPWGRKQSDKTEKTWHTHKEFVKKAYFLGFSLTSCHSQVSDQIRSVAQSCLTLCDPMNRSTPGLPVHHQLPEFTQTYVHRVSDGIQPSHPLSSPSPPAPKPSQHQSLFQ